jgi:hypothetical protein
MTPFAYLSGLSLYVQEALLACCAGILDNPTSPITDPLGSPLAVPLVADFPDLPLAEPAAPSGAVALVSPFVHAVAQLGALRLPNAYGTIGTDDTGQYLARQLYCPATQGIFTVYASSDASRRQILDWLQWGIISAYGVDGNGQTIDAYVLRSLRDWGLQPLLGGLFERPEFPPPDLAEPRPLGLPYRATLRLNLDVQVAWTTRPTLVPVIAQIQPTGVATDLVPPIVISIPIVIPHG